VAPLLRRAGRCRAGSRAAGFRGPPPPAPRGPEARPLGRRPQSPAMTESISRDVRFDLLFRTVLADSIRAVLIRCTPSLLFFSDGAIVLGIAN